MHSGVVEEVMYGHRLAGGKLHMGAVLAWSLQMFGNKYSMAFVTMNLLDIPIAAHVCMQASTNNIVYRI